MKTSLSIILGMAIGLVLASSFFLFVKGRPASVESPLFPPTVPADPADQAGELAFDQPLAQHDPSGDQQGPYYHDVYEATSTDGLNWTKTGRLLFAKSSVPDILLLPSGRLLVAAVDGGGRSRAGTMIALSDDNGATWRQGSAKTTDGKALGADPELVLLPDGTIRLYYVKFSQPIGSGPPNASLNWVESATSSDGITWTKESGRRFEYQGLTDPDVVKIKDTWLMYISQGRSDIATSSDDGLSFRLEKTIRTTGAVSNTVSIGEGKWRQFYCGDQGIHSAVTSDGLTFVDEGVRFSGDPGKIICDPAPVKLPDGTWYMVYKVGPAPAAPARSPVP